MNEILFLSLLLSFGALHIDESVFAFILAGNLGNLHVSRKEQCIHHLVWCIVSIWHIAITGVGYCLFDTGFPEPPADKRKMLHTFFCYNHIRGAGWSNVVIGNHIPFYEALYCITTCNRWNSDRITFLPKGRFFCVLGRNELDGHRDYTRFHLSL